MKRRTKVILGLIGLTVMVGGTSAVRATNGDSDDQGDEGVAVERGTIIDKALAVGTIEPDVEIEVKSQISGVVRRLFAEEGDFVRAGDPLIEIRPNPTPLELAEARRQVQLRQSARDKLRRDMERNEMLLDQGLISDQQYQDAQQLFEQADIQAQIASERLSLMEEGRISSEDGNVESVIRSPIDGHILEQTVEIGDPVVPLTTFQEGTALMRLAQMENLVFRGTVDEIDVGRLHEGMPVELQVGALPGTTIEGRLARISLKARTEDQATVFPVEIVIVASGEIVLRAGYSANAEVIIDRRDSVLVIPERLITFEGDSAWVTVQLGEGLTEVRTIETGLSDAINIEILDGLAEGERVREKPVKEIR